MLQSTELEVHFAVGEALVDCALGAQSPSGRNFWTEEDITLEKPQDNESTDQVSHLKYTLLLMRVLLTVLLKDNSDQCITLDLGRSKADKS